MNLTEMTARDLMTIDPVTIQASLTLASATKLMYEQKLRCLMVRPTKPGQGIGIITMKDVISILDEDDPGALLETRVADVMTRPAVCAQFTLGIPDCVNLMRMTGVRRMPILDGDELVGMLSYSDVFAHVASRL